MHDQRVADALKQREKKPSMKDESTQSVVPWSVYDGPVMMPHNKQSHVESNGIERRLSQFDERSIINMNHSNSLACDIVELFCKNIEGNIEESTACPRISSSTELEEDEVEVCVTCKDCAECQLLQQQAKDAAVAKICKIERDLSDQEEELTEHLDYYEDDVDGVETVSTSSMMTASSMERGDTPILVDLTSEESKPITWKQTILKRFNNAEESLEISGENVIKSKSHVSPK